MISEITRKVQVVKIMKKPSLIVLNLLILTFLAVIPACSPAEPILPGEIADTVRANMGYVLAPTWLPEGFEYSGPDIEHMNIESSGANIKTFPGSQTMILGYHRVVSMQQMDNFLISYPSSDTYPASSQKIQEILDLSPPDNAITEVTVNGRTALLYHGRWSDETLKRIQRLERPLDPEWDYEGSISVRFPIDVPGEGEIWVSISTVFTVVELTEDDLIRIAKSVVVVE